MNLNKWGTFKIELGKHWAEHHLSQGQSGVRLGEIGRGYTTSDWLYESFLECAPLSWAVVDPELWRYALHSEVTKPISLSSADLASTTHGTSLVAPLVKLLPQYYPTGIIISVSWIKFWNISHQSHFALVKLIIKRLLGDQAK